MSKKQRHPAGRRHTDGAPWQPWRHGQQKHAERRRMGATLGRPWRHGAQNKGFLFTLEAVSSVMLLIIAASFLPAFQLKKGNAETFFLCSDAAGVLIKSQAFSEGSLAGRVAELEGLSSLCIEADSGTQAAASSCPGQGGERISFTFPVLSGGRIRNARVSCWGPVD